MLWPGFLLIMLLPAVMAAMGGCTWLNLSHRTLVIVDMSSLIWLIGRSGRRPMASLVPSILQGEVTVILARGRHWRVGRG